jgi:polysaccharide deacetylase family protein (PEP-CTERM system associated)
LTETVDVSKYFLLTIDVEDWFQVENFKTSIPLSSWSSCESRVERNTHLFLDFLDMAGSKTVNGIRPGGPLRATFFVLGWVAERIPRLVREIQARGHEVASHGYHHNLCNHGTTEILKKDLSESKKTLEDILGRAVLGYRAPSFSISEEALGILEECGYSYDSSFNSFAGNNRYGKIQIFPNGTSVAGKTSRNIYELPISNLQIGKHIVPAGGGAYFRLIPVRVFEKIVQSVLKHQNAYVFYLHPWEADPAQPKVKEAPAFSRFRHYTNLSRTLPRLRFLVSRLRDISFVSCNEYILKTVK